MTTVSSFFGMEQLPFFRHIAVLFDKSISGIAEPRLAVDRNKGKVAFASGIASDYLLPFSVNR